MEFEQIFLIIWFIGFFGILSFFLIKGKKALSIFPDINSVNVRFRDQSSSGATYHKNLFKRGSASKVLDVVITDQELWLKSLWVFAYIAQRGGLLQKIKLTDIISVSTNGKKIDIEFYDVDGQKYKLWIKVKNTQSFLTLFESKTSYNNS